MFHSSKGTAVCDRGLNNNLSLLEKVYTEKSLVRVVHVETRASSSAQSWRKILPHRPLTLSFVSKSCSTFTLNQCK